jgi:peptidylamidoglycolate lyase
MQRRQFLQKASLASAGLMLGNTMAHAFNGDNTIFGHGEKRFTLDKDWGKLDFGKYPVKDCHEMVQDRKGRILLLTNETKNNVIIYNQKGKLIETWGTEYPGGHGLTLFDENGEDALFICDNNRHQVIKTNIKGKVLLTLDYPKETGEYTKAEEFIPTETALAKNGDIYVADGYGKDFIIQYDSSGQYIRHFGGRGSEPKHLLNAHGVVVDYRTPNKPSIIVTSRQENCFKRFSLEGEYLETIPLPGAWVCRPVIKGDYLYVAVLQSESNQWKQSGFVLVLNKDNKVVSNIGGNLPTYNNERPDEMYQTVKLFDYPHDVCVDNEGSIYVAQWNSNHVYPYKLTPVA